MEEHGARDGEGAATSPSHKWSPAPAPGAWWRPGERSERRGHRQLSRRHNAALFLSCAAKGVGTVSGVRYTCVTPGPGPGPGPGPDTVSGILERGTACRNSQEQEVRPVFLTA